MLDCFVSKGCAEYFYGRREPKPLIIAHPHEERWLKVLLRYRHAKCNALRSRALNAVSVGGMSLPF